MSISFSSLLDLLDLSTLMETIIVSSSTFATDDEDDDDYYEVMFFETVAL